MLLGTIAALGAALLAAVAFVVSTLGPHLAARMAFFLGVYGGWFVLVAGMSFYARGLNQLTGRDASMVRLCQDLYRGLLRPIAEEIRTTGHVSWRVNAAFVMVLLPFLIGQNVRMAHTSHLLILPTVWAFMMVALIWLGSVAVAIGMSWTALAEGRWEPAASLRDAEQGRIDMYRLLFRRGFYPAVGTGTEKKVPFPIEGLREELQESWWPRDPHWQRGLILGLGLLALAYGLFGFWLVANPPGPAIAIALIMIYAGTLMSTRLARA
jgi:hypothetical protein